MRSLTSIHVVVTGALLLACSGAPDAPTEPSAPPAAAPTAAAPAPPEVVVPAPSEADLHTCPDGVLHRLLGRWQRVDAANWDLYDFASPSPDRTHSGSVTFWNRANRSLSMPGSYRLDGDVLLLQDCPYGPNACNAPTRQRVDFSEGCDVLLLHEERGLLPTRFQRVWDPYTLNRRAEARGWVRFPNRTIYDPSVCGLAVYVPNPTSITVLYPVPIYATVPSPAARAETVATVENDTALVASRRDDSFVFVRASSGVSGWIRADQTRITCPYDAAATPIPDADPDRAPSAPPPTAAETECTWRISDPRPPTRIRPAPGDTSTSLGEPTNGTEIRIVSRSGRWVQIDQPTEGWVFDANISCE